MRQWPTGGCQAKNKQGKPIPYRPQQAVKAPGGSGCHISLQSAHGGDKVVRLTHRSPLPSGDSSGTHFCWLRHCGWGRRDFSMS